MGFDMWGASLKMRLARLQRTYVRFAGSGLRFLRTAGLE
jgi:hypothetical protein